MTTPNNSAKHPQTDSGSRRDSDHGAPVYIFQHTPKCAGTTFRVHVEQNLAQDEAIALYADKTPRFAERDAVVDYVTSLSDEQKAKVKLIYGHECYYGIHELLGREGKYFTFLRDPLARTISWYNFRRQKGWVDDRIIEQYIANDIVPTLEQWLVDSPWVWNEMIGYFADYGYCPRQTSYTQDEVKELLDRFFFVGLTETFDRDALFIFERLGIRKRFFKPQNVSKKYFQPEDKEKVRAAILEKNQYDVALYQLAFDRHEKLAADYDYRGKVAWMQLLRTISPVTRRLSFDRT